MAQTFSHKSAFFVLLLVYAMHDVSSASDYIKRITSKDKQRKFKSQIPSSANSALQQFCCQNALGN